MPGIGERCELLIECGVGVEAGPLELADAHAFVVSGLAARCARVLLSRSTPIPARRSSLRPPSSR